MAPRKPPVLLSADRLDALAEERSILQARVNDIDGQLRSHFKASGVLHVEARGLHIFMAQTVYHVTNPHLAAQAFIGYVYDKLIPNADKVEAVRDWLMAIRSDGYVAAVKTMPGQDRLKQLMDKDSDGGLVVRRSKEPNLGVRTGAPDGEKQTLFLPSQPGLREWEIEIEPEDVDFDDLPAEGDDGDDDGSDPWERD